jgi:hypothetical protein
LEKRIEKTEGKQKQKEENMLIKGIREEEKEQ